jgi:hypothetical protein
VDLLIMANLGLKPPNPSLTRPPKVAVNLPKPAKVAAPKLSGPATQKALSPLFGKKNPRPVVQSTPTRTPSF